MGELSMRRWVATLCGGALLVVLGSFAPLADAADAADGGAALLAKHRELEPALARSPFARPLVLTANSSARTPHGDVHAVLAYPFATVAAALRSAEQWCDMLILPFNVKRCDPVGEAPNARLQLAVGRKSDQPATDAYPLRFDYQLRADESEYLAIELGAPEGPLGTSDYRLAIEAVPLSGGRTFVHMSYSYANGMAARIATSAYLATAGRSKIGFTIVDRDADGRPVHVGGLQGVAERNTMRYFLAIEAFLKTRTAPPGERLERRLREWFAATERYAPQLHEMELDEYLAMKRKEARHDGVRSAARGSG